MTKHQPRLLVVNLTRGIFDGVYFAEGLAAAALAHWRERFPADRIVLVDLVDDDRLTEGVIPDHRFMAAHEGTP